MKKKCNKYYLVDDSYEFIQAMQLYIEKELGGIVCGYANDGSEALKDDALHSADIILMDIMMKQMNGFDAIHNLQTQFNNLKIIAITNSYEYISMHYLLAKGFKGCVFKNRVFRELPEALSKIVSGSYYFSKGISVNEYSCI